AAAACERTLEGLIVEVRAAPGLPSPKRAGLGCVQDIVQAWCDQVAEENTLVPRLIREPMG
ncbi:MAG: hypothetical protein KDJ67_08965, partial [Nitratireductor sp.]|nr:hypothetical protein [Nitratireductor sp.]